VELVVFLKVYLVAKWLLKELIIELKYVGGASTLKIVMEVL
jgi:hypothetical protein